MMKKYLGVLLLASSLLSAQQFMTGQAARAVFGQQTFTAQDQQTSGATPYELGAPGGVAYTNNMLIVADANHVGAIPAYERVLIYTSISDMLPSLTQSINIPGPNFVRCPLCIGTTDTPLVVYTLGGYPPNATYTPDYNDYGINSQSFRTPTAVATNGTALAVADTDNNRVLIWNNIPLQNGIAADIVLGQPDFNTVNLPTVTASTFRGPQGVWFQGNRFFVADTGNNRVMIWNSIPTSNNKPADIVLGVPNFTTSPQQDLTKATLVATATNMANPVSVTSDGTRLFVSDLGNNRVLIWNTIPSSNDQAADMAIGQPDLVSNADNNANVLCPSNGTDSNGNLTYPQRCAATLSFPRFALSDGARLYIADGGNDRILIFNSLPGQNGQRADVVLGEPDEFSDNTTDSTDTFFPDANIGRSSADTVRTPLSLAWDGINLYATDAYDRRVLVFTPASPIVPLNGIVNAASQQVNAIGAVDLSGTITAGDTATITIGTTNYTYTVVKTDTLDSITTSLVSLINANGGDPNVLAVADVSIDEVDLTARQVGAAGNNIALSTSTTGAGSTSTTTNAATIILTASGATLERGGNAAEVAPGTIVTLYANPGSTLADATAAADPKAPSLPTSLGGVEVYFDGMKAPLSFVSPGQINAQMPFEVYDASSVSAYIRVQHNDGTVTVTDAIGVPIVLDNPGIFAYDGPEPRQAIAYHASSNAIAVVDIEGGIQAGDTATVSIDGRNYNYAVQSTDTLDSIRDNLIALINSDPDERVTATAAGQYDRIILTAKTPGPDGNGIAVSTNQTSTVSAGAQIALTALQSQTCCSSVAGALVTADNPAVPGEVITVYATGLGVVQPDDAKNTASDGVPYPMDGPPNSAAAPVDNAQVGASTANVLNSGLQPGLVGVYAVQLQLDQSLTTNALTQMYIAQDVFTSNITTIPVVAPSTSTTASTTTSSARPQPARPAGVARHSRRWRLLQRSRATHQ